MRYNFYDLKEPGVDPARSNGFYFTQLPSTLKYYYYITECGHYFLDQNYLVKRDYFPPNLIFLILDGVLTMEYRGHIYHLKKNDIFFLDCTEPQCYHASTQKLEFMFIHFDGCNSHDLVKHLLDTRGGFAHHSNKILLKHLIVETLHMLEQDHVESIAATSLRVYKILTYLHETSDFHKKEINLLETTELYINKHMNQKITLQNLAAEAGLSEYYFSRSFKLQTGVSPIEYVTMKKLEYASALLTRTDRSVSDIADKIGYSLRSFINLWTSHYEFSPTKYRKLMSSRREFEMPVLEDKDPIENK